MTRNQAIAWHELTHPRVPAGRYLINKLGQVKNAKTGHLLTNCVAKSGYTQVCLTVAPGRTLSIKTHRLVAETFLPNPSGHGYINHKDENKANNHISNLEWCDAHYNNYYSKADFYQSLKGRGVGDRARFTDEDIEDMKMFRAAKIKLRDIARAYGTSNTYVCNLVNGKIVRSA